MSSSQSPAKKSADALIGRVINGRFRVIELLARGGMGRVYRAEQVPLKRQVALKVLDRPSSGEADNEFETRFLNEASTAAKLQLARTLEAVKALPPAVQEAFRLHKLEGLSHAETAAAMGVSRSSVEKYMMASLKLIVAKVGRWP